MLKHGNNSLKVTNCSITFAFYVLTGEKSALLNFLFKNAKTKEFY